MSPVYVTMLNKINISSGRQKLIVYIFLAVVTLAVFWQVNQYDFINFDDNVYVSENSHIRSGITLDGFRWAFSTLHAQFWHPLTWLSLMFDYQLYGLNAGGYHLTNVILHILSALLLFWLFNRMTGAVWRSAFVAAFFALHPLRVESVAWVAERKEVLSGFFWMLTLCLYVYYTEKPAVRRYLLVVFCFVCGLMSKPMVVTLPVIMILMDYWPLRRFESQKGNVILWQLKEKTPLFILSAFFSIITIYAQQKLFVNNFSIRSRFANAPVSFITYLEKTFWPHDMAVFYPFSDQLPVWQVWGSTILIIVISVAVILMVKRMPYLFVGWLWYAIALLPVIGIIRSTLHSIHDTYTYLPSIGIAIMLAWGIPSLFKSENMRKKILLPSSIFTIIIMLVLTRQQCGYWKNSVTIFSHAVKVTKDNHIAHNNLGAALAEKGKTKEANYHFNEAIRIQPDYAIDYRAIDNNNKGILYSRFAQYELANKYYNEAIRLNHNYSPAYYNRGSLYMNLGQHQLAIEDFNNFLRLDSDCAICYHKKGIIYGEHHQYRSAIDNFSKAINLKPDYFKAYKNRGFAYAKLGEYQNAIDDYSEALLRQPNDADTYHHRSLAYLLQNNIKSFCDDGQKACALGNCKIFEFAKDKGICH
jgi:protein O-mannosyl-transferase